MRDCDVVLKGGVTSGVIYGGTLIALGRVFRLRKIGGTSAGAIAAGIAGAAEYRRQGGGAPGFAELLRRPVDELSTPGFMGSLLRPADGAGPALRIGLELLRPHPAAAVLRVLLATGWWLCAVVLVLTTAATVAVAWSGAPWWVSVALAVLLWLVAALVCVGGSAALIARSTWRVLNAPEHGFALCSGLPEADEPALTTWLHETIQRTAGLEPERPLTFSDLEQRGIELAMITTDLGGARPVRLPATAAYWFDEAEFRRLLPEPVVAHLVRAGARDDATGLRRLPVGELPVLVGVRMSLSVPLLLAAVPVHPAGADGRPSRERRSWFTDGGVTSNFPIHFFDSWLPERPTFGIDLRPFPVGRDEARERVHLPAPDAPVAPRWNGIDGVLAFGQQVVDAVQNWRDTAQAELPGFRDRVCEIRLKPGEGGFNLHMDADTLLALVEAGDAAGCALLERFDEAGFERHRRARSAGLAEAMRPRVFGFEDDYHDILWLLLERWFCGRRELDVAEGDVRLVPRT